MWRWLCWWRPPCLLRRVVLNFNYDTTEALEGVLWSSRGPWCVLREVSALKAGQPAMRMVGDVVVHRSQVAYLQVVE